MNVVHTAGVNWESVGTIIVALTGVFAFFFQVIDRRARDRQSTLETRLGSQDAKIEDLSKQFFNMMLANARQEGYVSGTASSPSTVNRIVAEEAHKGML